MYDTVKYMERERERETRIDGRCACKFCERGGCGLLWEAIYVRVGFFVEAIIICDSVRERMILALEKDLNSYESSVCITHALIHKRLP